MLRSLTIRNFAVIEELRLELSPGLNALTGETGAGKSILIEALGFLLGDRASASWLRAGARKLEVEAVFDASDLPEETRAAYGISGPLAAVRREFEAGGKTRAAVNGRPAPVSALAELGERLVDFHGQHEQQTLLRPSVQLELLDRFGGLEAEAGRAAEAYERWAALGAEKERGRLSEEERERRLEAARFQLQEIARAGPRPGEEGELEAALPRLKNAGRLQELSSLAYGLLYEQEGCALGQLMKAAQALGELARLDGAMAEPARRLGEARLALREVAEAVGDCRESSEASPARLDEVLSRLDLLARLKRKYGGSLEAVLDHRERAAREVESLENSDRRAGELAAELAAAESALAEASERLHALRLKAARRIESGVLKELKALGMAQADFSAAVEFEEGRYSRSGADAVELMLSPNPGEPLKPVRAAASGGELSRVMLALKTVLAEADRVPILVFDEVDAGVGGAVGRAVGQRLSTLSRNRQVLCITHLAQVACFARAHFLVAKSVEKGRTVIEVGRAEGDGRLDALALMLGGRAATAASRKHAQELLLSSSGAA